MEPHEKKRETDFLIAGAGPAGLITGILLRRQGHSVAIADKNNQQNRPVCGEYLAPEGRELLQELGLSAVLKERPPIWGMKLYSPQGREVLTRFPEGKYGISLDRKLFQERLAEIFEELGGEIFYSTRVVEFVSNEEGFLVKTEGGSIPARYLIGADGRQSVVARLLGLQISVGEEKRFAIHCFLRSKVPLENLGQMHVMADGSYIGINPLSECEANVSVVTSSDSLRRAGGAKELLNFWITSSQALNSQFHPVTQEELRTVAPVSSATTAAVSERAALIGDASGFVDPLTGEGITMAIKTAALLTECLERTGQIERGFELYGGLRKKNFAPKESINRSFQGLIRRPLLCEALALTLGSSRRLADIFIGLVGNVYSPSVALKKAIQKEG